MLRIVLWAVLVGAAWLFRVWYNAWPGPWLFACVAALPPVLFLLSLPSMLGLKIQFEGPGRVVRGTKAEYTLRFTDERLLPVHAVTVQLALCNRYTEKVTHESYRLRSLSSARLALPLPTEECGVVSCRVTRCELQDLLGLFVIRRSFDTELTCAVLPEAQEARVDLDAALDAVRILKPKYGGGFAEDHDLRPYRPGDTANSIHWKLSSKLDEPIVREPLIPENSTIFIVLSRVGEGDRGLEVLRWLSRKLTELDEPHVIVADSLYPVGNEEETDDAVASILSWPLREPCGFDANGARCIFTISAGEVRWQ